MEENFELINIYCNEYLTLPVVEACRARGLFELLARRPLLPQVLLAKELGANEGYFAIALESLAILGWIATDKEGVCTAGPRARLKSTSVVASLYAFEPTDLLKEQAAKEVLRAALHGIFEEGKPFVPQLTHPGLGPILVILAAALQEQDDGSLLQMIDSFEPLHAQGLRELLVRNEWTSSDRTGLTVAGMAFIENPAVRLAAFYRPILQRVPALLFGDSQTALKEIGHETTLLWDKQRDICPVFVKGKAALADWLKGAATQERSWKTVSFDHGYGALTQALARSLACMKQPEQNVLSVSGSLIQGRLTAHRNEALRLLAAEQPSLYLDDEAKLVDALTVLSCWQQRLRHLVERIAEDRALTIQAHTYSGQWGHPGYVGFDCIDRLTHEHPISANAFLTLAAGEGLFADGFRWFPQTHRPCTLSLLSLVKREYVVRNATENDLDRLCRLEELCWQHTRTQRDQILLRLQRYPYGQFVLEKAGQVLGVIYSQRIDDLPALVCMDAGQAHTLHQPTGSIVQLLAINIDPQTQSGGLGDRLLEFMLQRTSLLLGVRQIVGVTLCKNYRLHHDVPFDEYIKWQGSERDPVLTFHHEHGAEIVSAVPGYRPEDRQNLGNGVLVSYDPFTRKPRRRERAPQARDKGIDGHTIERFVVRESATLLGCDPLNVEMDSPLMEMGLDSVDLLKLQGQVEDHFQVLIELDFFFKYNTVRKVVHRLAAQLDAEPTQTTGTSSTPIWEAEGDLERRGTRAIESEIAVVGMACKLPGGIESPDQLWQVLADAECVVGEYPASRGSWPAGSGIEHGGFVHDLDAFDAAFFRISPVEAEMTDPQQRMLLQVAWACLEDAGVRPEELKSSKTGVFLGASNLDYGRLLQEAGMEVEAHHGVGNSLAVLANRLSYFFDLSGPSLTIDTACSSSLVAMHTALLSLRSGQCSAALVGGVNVICHPGLSIAYQKAGMLAPDGRCKAFDAKANGYVRSEGAVLFLLKPLSAAVAAGDQIHGVIKGGATNHGGLAAGLTVPNPQSQSDLLIAAWRDAEISAHDLTYLESHGTGTSLGDPIEIQGIKMAYAATADASNAKRCAIASVKGNLGHLESAAGAAGLLKVILAMQHRQIPASILWQKINPKIDLKDTPFFIPNHMDPWTSTEPCLAAVSSFGSGGANAHIVLQEYPRPVPTPASVQQHLFVLSAATEASLREYARQVIAWCEGASAESNWEDAIYTWQSGRTAMKVRLALRVANPRALTSLLVHWLSENATVNQLWYGKASHDATVMYSQAADGRREAVMQAMRSDDLPQLGMLWVSGMEVNWHRYYDLSGRRHGHRISLPTYPFAKTRFWIKRNGGNFPADNRAWDIPLSITMSHPLLQRNTSAATELRFSGEFSGDEFFLSDHRVQDRRVMPAACYIEMARAAAAVLSKSDLKNPPVRLVRVSWLSPLIANGPTIVHLQVDQARKDEVAYEIYSDSSTGTEVGQKLVHSRGRVCMSAGEAPRDRGPFDLRRLKAWCDRSLEAADCYRLLHAIGLTYGPGHQGIERIHTGVHPVEGHFLLAEIVIPASVGSTREQFGLHPAFLDAALQAALVFSCMDSRATSKLSLPFEVQEIWTSGHAPAGGYAYLRGPKAQGQNKPSSLRPHSLDIDLCDESGLVCARLKGFVAREVKRDLDSQTQHPIEALEDPLASTTLLCPVWDAVTPPRLPSWPAPHARVLLVGASSEEQRRVSARFEDVRVVESSADLDLQAESTTDHILWFVPASHAEGVEDERLLSEQGVGVVEGFRLIKALHASGWEAKPLGWTIVTKQTQAVHVQDTIWPSQASVHGMVGAVAKEYPAWKIRLVDVPIEEEWPMEEVLTLPADPRGESWAYRSGEWYRRHLVPWIPSPAGTVPFRENGVYVIIGGAGGIGEAFSRYLIQKYDAQMIWIGRRELNAEIQTKIDQLGQIGSVPVYIRADATDQEALARAYESIKSKWREIHGLIHGAIVLADKTLGRMDEEAFKASFAAKTDVCVRMAQVFRDEPMDFVAFFSSVLGLTRPAGQSNYVSGCAFVDAFAHQLSRTWSCPVKVMNWGYWGTVGVVAAEAYRRRMEQDGIGSIEPAAGIRALEHLLSTPLLQLAQVKAQPRALEAMQVVSEQIMVAPLRTASGSPKASFPTRRVISERSLEERRQRMNMQRLMTRLLSLQMRQLGLFAGEERVHDLGGSGVVVPAHHRWLAESLRIVARGGYEGAPVGEDGFSDSNCSGVAEEETAWCEWEAEKTEWLGNAALRAEVRLVDATLRALPEILTGKRRSTDVLFPGSSTELVEGFYKNNPTADYFNAVLADLLVEFVDQQTKADPAARIRIVEIGAGSGGTSETLFRRLEAYAGSIAEYCYTDLSKAFLIHAEQAYGPTTPYLNYRVLDIERSIETQGIIPGSYDVVIATNVLHATKNIRSTLRNAKALLKQNGALLLNELLGGSLFTHLTFGLLEGWWLPEDIALRTQGTPLLSSERWKLILEEQGFKNVVLPSVASHSQGQQIIAAQSDGVIRQNVSKTAADRTETTNSRLDVQDLLLDTSTRVEPLREMTVAALKKLMGRTLKLPVQDFDEREPLETYGVDSILIVSMVDALRDSFEHISSTTFFEYRTIDALARHFLDADETAARRWVGMAAAIAAVKTENPSVAEPVPSLDIGRHEATSEATPAKTRSKKVVEDIAVVGLSGRYPGSNTIAELWRNLREGRDCITEVPADRWDWRKYYSADGDQHRRHLTNRGGFIAGVDEFDPQFFNIAPSEAHFIDPQERLFLQHAWMAVEDAGYTRASMQTNSQSDLAAQVGVYAGVMYSEYQLLHNQVDPVNLKMGFAGNLASVANRVSSVLNLHGPSVTVDTMCSSSLTAIHYACQDLKQGRTNLAIAGGVNVSIHPNKYLMLSAGQFLSSDGRCQSFGEGGEGFVPAEGVGVAVLKRLSDAERDGDHIYGVIRGSAINHGGKTNGYTVPNPQAQSSVIAQALAESGIDARSISYVEAHGTGTKLGDPIEIAALSKAYRQHTPETGYCLIGSVKSNIGHCESAAGIAGLTKLLLQLKHRQIVPSLHAQRVNPHIDFSSTPFVVNQHLQDWHQPEVEGRKLPRLAGLSSFGAGGSNAHLIVEEHVASPPALALGGEFLVLLSARRELQLRGRVEGLLGFVGSCAGAVDLASLSYTLQVGREAMEERLAWVVSSTEELVAKLAGYLAGDVDGVYTGQVRGNKDLVTLFSRDAELQQAVERWIAGRKWSRLLELWVKGVEVDWNRLYGARKPCRMSLPVYPFARERYWIEPAAARGQGAGGAVLHPLLHRNTSDLLQQRYSTRLGGGESFLVEEAGERVVGSWSYLEMARAAVEQATGGRPAHGWEFADVSWGEPLVAREGVEMHLAVLAGGERLGFEVYSSEAGRDADGVEAVHCQGWVQASSAALPLRLSVGSLGEGNGELWVRLPVAEAGFGIAPGVLGAAFSAAQRWSGAPSGLPSVLTGARIVSACGPEMLARIRHGSTGVDIDLCDSEGRVSAELRGLVWQAASPARAQAERSVEVPTAAPSIALFEPVEMVWQPAVRSWQASVVEKPRGLPLEDPLAGAAGSWPAVQARKPSVTLGALEAVVGGASVRIVEEAEGVFHLRIEVGAGMGALTQALERVELEPALKVVRLSGLEHGFAEGGRVACRHALEHRLYASLVRFPAPVIASLTGDGVGALWLAASLCDLLVLNERARYGYIDSRLGVYPSASEAALVEERFGRLLAHEFLYGPGPLLGWELRARGYTVRMVASGETEPEARRLAVELAAKPRRALRLLKQHLVRRLPPLVDRLDGVEPVAGRERAGGAVEMLPLGHPEGAGSWVRQFGQGLEEAVAGGARAVVLTGSEHVFSGEEVAQVGVEFARLVRSSGVPVVSALEQGGQGAGWLVGQMCDGCVWSREGEYAVEQWSEETAALVLERLGQEMGLEMLLCGGEYRGAVLEQQVCGLRAAAPEQVLAVAREMAGFWAELPPATLAMARQRDADALAGWRKSLSGLCGAGAQPLDAEPPVAVEPGPIVLRSTVVTAAASEDGVVLVRMQDRAARNMFSRELQEGMAEVFAHIERTPGYRAVVLTGYDSYFSSGGTRESLLAIQAGEVRFTDIKLFQLPLDCRLPVVAAMQGHGIGAGWSLGMFADLVVLSEESRYESPYMNFGFTPGAGATWVLGEKLGVEVARESLLTGAQYSGRDLRERGVRAALEPRAASLGAALELARRIAARPQRLAMELKARLRAGTAPRLEETYRRELAMHAETFVGQADTLARIERSFERQAGPSPASQPASPPTPQPQAAAQPPEPQSVPLAAIVAELKALLAAELRLRASEIDEEVEFIDLGLDSINGVTWLRAINARYQTAIEITKVYSYPTLTQLGRHIRQEVEKKITQPAGPADNTPPAPAPMPDLRPTPPTAGLTSWRKPHPHRFATTPKPRAQPAVTPIPTRTIPQPIAIIGMAGQFPQAKNLNQFWQNLAKGKNCISTIPEHRWDLHNFYHADKVLAGKTNSQWAGMIDHYDCFDPQFFNISPTEAESMDPQQRLLLETCWHAIEDGGYSGRSLSGSRCGMFVGCTQGDYHLLSREQQLSAHGFTGNASSILAGRISYFLDLQGPCLSIDTACSSSLVALSSACDSLVSGASDVALCGGVYVMTGPEMHIKTAQAGMLSSRGVCATFDQQADGFVPGEGVGVVMLKRLSDAERDGDHIYGVIEGWGVNQDGKTNGITAPNPDAQARLQQEVYERFGIDPSEIQLIEAHGTGTKLGDPIEVEGLKKAFQKYTHKRESCAIGSVKSNIGHCLTAAGIAGFLKLILALEHRQLPPTIHFETLNEHIDLSDSPFYVNRHLQPWLRNGAAKRRAAISSLGFSGTNAHLVVAEYTEQETIPPPALATQQPRHIVPLSAKTPEQLRQKVQQLSECISDDATAPSLLEIAYTLQIGRDAMEERVSFIADSRYELIDKLQAYLDGTHAHDYYSGEVKRNKEAISFITQDEEMKHVIVSTLIAEQRLGKLAELWSKGVNFNWKMMYNEQTPRRVSLPHYPFTRQRYWIRQLPNELPVCAAKASTLHPLLHRNTSDLTQQSFSSAFTGKEFFLADHQLCLPGLSRQMLLPGVAYLEMVRAALEQVAPAQMQSSLLELRDTVWLQPLIVPAPTQTSLNLLTDETGQLHYNIDGLDHERKIVFCRGQVVFHDAMVAPTMNLEDIARQIGGSPLSGSEVYLTLAKMGLSYGPAHQSIVSLLVGQNQAFAKLRLPNVIAGTEADYVLHPSLVDGSLQASVGLIADQTDDVGRPFVPFALHSLRIFSACMREMTAWVRNSSGSRYAQHTLDFDVDLCDPEGNVCVQMRGLAARRIEDSSTSPQDHLLATSSNKPTRDSAFYEQLLEDVLKGELSIDEAVALT